jgi:O-antigen/teichoic acid export membrane protein
LQRKFLSNLGFLIFVNLIVKPVYIFGIDRVIQNHLGEEIYGSYYAIMKFALIISILLDLGIENFNRREIAQNDQLLNKYFSNFIVLKLLLGGIYLSIGFFGAMVSGYAWPEVKLLLLILVNEFLRSMIMYLRANLGGLHKFKTDSIFSVLDRVVMILVCGFLLIHPQLNADFKIEWFILSQTFAYGISMTLAFVSVFKKTSYFRPSLKSSYTIAIIKQLSPFALLVFLMSIYTHIDPFLLERLLDNGKHQAGVYAQSSRILEACANYSYLFAIILLPVFSKMLRKKQNIEEILNLSYFLIIIPSLLAVASFVIFRQEIMWMLYHSKEVASPRIFGTLMFSLLGFGTTYVYGTLLTANGNLKQLSIIALIGVGTSLALNLILIPQLTAYGASIANISSQLFTALLQIILVHYHFRIKVEYSRWIKLGLYFAWMYFGGLWLYQHLAMHWIWEFAIVVSMGIVLAFAIIYKDLVKFLDMVKT